MVLYEIWKIDNYLVKDRTSLTFIAFFENSLDNSASISMDTKATYCSGLFNYGRDDEINAIRGHLFNALLNNMIPILIEDAL